jgi:uncharacterized protein (TIRG00374 family)
VEIKLINIAWKKLFSFIIRIIVSAVILYFIFSLVPWNDTVAAYKTAEGSFIIYGASLLLLNILVRTIKWKIALQSVKKEPSFKEAFGSLMLGISLGSFTPGEIGEFAGRAMHISNAKKSHIVGLSLLDKAQIFIVTGAFGVISISILFIPETWMILAVSLIVTAVSFYLLLHIEIFALVANRINTIFLKRSVVTRIFEGFALLTGKQLVICICLTILFHLIIIFQVYFLINAFFRISLIETAVAASAMFFTKSLLPFSLGDLGIREAGTIYFFSLYGIPNVASLNASLLLFFVNIFIPSLIGTYYLRHQHLSISQVFNSLKNRNGS